MVGTKKANNVNFGNGPGKNTGKKVVKAADQENSVKKITKVMTNQEKSELKWASRTWDKKKDPQFL